jgi:hypothetical protein
LLVCGSVLLITSCKVQPRDVVVSY